jgi:hypothetical protein
MNCHLLRIVICSTVALAITISAQEVVDENALFSDTNSIVDSSTILDPTLSESKAESTHVGFSGSINSVVEAGATRNYFDDFSRQEITPSAYLVGNFLLDIRLPMNVKAFGNLETQFNADSSNVDFSIKELFVDANIERTVYFRTGKQVLQWGRCYFWNPTDLVNVERKSVEPQIGYREGAYGVKMHIPFGTKYNLYGFLDMKRLTSVDSLAGAFRSEVLIGTTEIGVELCGKKDREPVFGMDFSTTIFDVEINGEISLESGKNYNVINGLKANESLIDFIARSPANMESTIGNKPIPKICVGFSKSFNLLDVKDRVKVISEFYYNKAGVPGNFFEEHKAKEAFDLLSTISNDTNNSALETKLNKLKAQFVNPNNFSRYYLALFTTVNKFITPDMTFQFNGVINLEQNAATLSTSLEYSTIHNLSIGLTLSGNVGSDETEYTIQSSAMSARLNLGVTF